MTREKAISEFGIEWYSVLEEYLLSSEFSKLGKTIGGMRSSGTIVYPETKNIFRIFREVPYNKLRVCMISQDPYHDGSASGIAFDNSEAFHISPSLKFIHQEIELEYPELIDRFEMPFGGLDKGDLSYLVKQGVFLYNTALTVEKGKPGSHMDLWQEFTSKVIEAINKIDFVVWILLGKFAASFESKINNKHVCLKAPHPASTIYNINSGFLNSGIFRQCNYHLNSKGLQEIQW